MPDAHVGIGATVGAVIATRNAIIPEAVGIDGRMWDGRHALQPSKRAIST
jgi:hypothetical protein